MALEISLRDLTNRVGLGHVCTVTRLLSLLVVGLLIAAVVEAASVRGYSRRDGTSVQPHVRTNPDGNPFNNDGFPGNDNPNTGKITSGDQQRSLDRYHGGRGGLGGSGISQNPFDR